LLEPITNPKKNTAEGTRSKDLLLGGEGEGGGGSCIETGEKENWFKILTKPIWTIKGAFGRGS